MIARVTLMLAMCGGLIGRTARADNDDAPRSEEPTDLETILQESVVSTPTRSSGGASAAPAVTSTISDEDLRRYGIRSLAEAINFLSLGMVTQDATLGGTKQIGARGVMLPSNSQVLVLINGHTINDQGGAVASILDLGSLPIELVDHIEVMLGPGSVLYGGNAMLGVINVITRSARQHKGVKAVTEWSAVPAAMPRTSGFGLASRHALGAGAHFELFGVPSELTMQLQYAQNDRPTFEYGPSQRIRQIDSSFANPNALARLQVRNWEATLYVSGSRGEESPRNEVPIRTGGPQGPAGAGHRAGRMNLDVVYRQSMATSLGVMGRMFGDFTRTDDNVVTYDGLYGCPLGMNAGCVTTTKVATPRVGAELQGTYDWPGKDIASTTVGVIGMVRHLSATIDSTDVNTGTNPARQLDLDRLERSGAIYLQQVVKPTRRWSFNGGLRFDYESRFGNKLSPRLAAVYTPWNYASIKAIYSEAFRGPDIVESFFYHPTLLMRAGDLKPETVKSAELFFEQRVGTHRIFHGVFRTWWSDLVMTRYYNDLAGAPESERDIVRAAKERGELNPIVPSVLRYENIASIDNYGANAGMDGSFRHGQLQYGINVVIAQALSGSGPISGAPRLSGNARLSYDFKDGLPTAALAASASGRRSGRYGTSYPAELYLRTIVSGPFPGIPQLSYRGMFEYAVHDRSTSGTPVAPEGEQVSQLFPSDRITVMIGLSYHLQP